MNARQIEAFQAVMTTGSLTRAGERMLISQPAVSQLVAQFERSCGFPLFERTGNKIAPTREAEALFIEVQRMFTGVGQISRVATALRDRTWGSLSIAAFPAIARRVVPDIMWSFCKDRPETRIRVESMRSRGMIDAAAAQQIDIGLSILPSDRPEVECTLLHSLRGVCILPLGHPLAAQDTVRAKDMADRDFISLGPQDQTRFMVDRIFDQQGLSRRLRVEVGQAETAFTFVAAGAGIAVIDPVSAYNNRGAGIIIRRFEPSVYFDIWLVRPKVVRPFNLIDSALEYMIARLCEFANLCEILPDLPAPDLPPSLTETFLDLLSTVNQRS